MSTDCWSVLMRRAGKDCRIPGDHVASTGTSNRLKSASSVFFFFQAEDGIRDDLVTGVQTCALPISAQNLSPAPEFSATTPSSPRETFATVPARLSCTLAPGNRPQTQSLTTPFHKSAALPQMAARAPSSFPESPACSFSAPLSQTSMSPYPLPLSTTTSQTKMATTR